MIICFSGTPGSGKTYEVVEKIMDALKLGRKVYTNVEGFEEREYQEYQKAFTGLTDFQYATQMVYLSKEKAQMFWQYVEKGSLIVIDEIHKLFSNRDWSTDENKQFTEWASTHRHEGFDMVMLTQSNEKIDKHIRSLIEWTYFFRKVNYFGSLVKASYQRHAYEGDQERGTAVQRHFRKYNPKIFKCYKSYIAKDIKELNLASNINILKHPIFFVIPVILIFALYMLFFKSSLGSGDLFGVKTYKEKREKEKKAVPDLAGKIIQDEKGNTTVIVPSKVKYQSKIIEENDKNFKTKVNYVDKNSDSLPVENPVSCRTSGEIVIGNDIIEIERCGCKQIKKINGQIVYEKILSKERCEVSKHDVSPLPVSRKGTGTGL